MTTTLWFEELCASSENVDTGKYDVSRHTNKIVLDMFKYGKIINARANADWYGNSR